MTYDQIQNLFKQRYNQSNWKKFLSEAFANTRLLAKPVLLTGIDSNVASQVQKLGYIILNENGIERQIAVYEVTLAQGIFLERNRVGLRNLLRKYWKDIDAAFIAYHRPETPNWRFTYVSELTGYDADGEFVKLKTEPKRYTYVLGEGESTRTAAERFTAIATKGSKATLDDVKEAFSVEKLSKAFFDEYKKHYDIFCDFMVSKPNIRQTIFNGDEKGIRDFVKKLLGRIVFLYFIQKKGWLGVPLNEDWGKGNFNFLTNQFENFKNQDLFYQNFLSLLFFETLNQKRDNDIALFLNHGNPNNPKNHGSNNCRIPYLNGGLFEEEDKKHRNLIFPANLFKSLFDFFNQYNFTIYEDDPNDHTVAVDPEMLGHIFENLLEDNKDKGAYYTPKEIVHYMCQESLIEYLATYCQNIEWNDLGITLIESEQRQWIESLIKKKEAALIESSQSKKSYQSWFRHLNTALDNVKICDPAIGSGAFPMGLLHEIFTAKQTLHTFEHGNTKTFDASAVKLNIIQNSIYGVDIEKGAVDIARLRFWLSLIVDEEKPKALPNLDYKIVVGNSLVSKLGDDIIDIDWTLNETSYGLFGTDLAKQKGDLLKKISKEQKEFFNPDSDKKKLAADIRNLKIDLLITQLELMVKTQGIETQPTGTGKAIAKQTERYLQTMGWKNSIKDLQKLKNKPELPLHFFDWKLDFPEVMNEQVTANVGFDIVIGNPPYVQLQKNGGLLASEFEKQGYLTFERTGDIYSLFYEKGILLLKDRGTLNFITSNKWMRAGYGASTRAFFTQHNPLKIIDLGSGIFESATVDTNILIIQKSKNQQHCLATDLSKKKNTTINFADLTWVTLKNLNKDAWTIAYDMEQNIKTKIERIGKPLKEWDINIYRGILTGYNKAFIIDGKKKDQLIAEDPKSAEIIKPILRGRDIKRYKAEFADLWLIATFPALKLDINQYPAVKKYLESFGKRLHQTGENFIDENGAKAKARKKTGNKWFETQDQIGYHQEFEKEKIAWASVGESYYTLVEKNMLLLDTNYFFAINKNTKFLLSILNSRLIIMIMNSKDTLVGSIAYRHYKYNLEELTIPNISLKEQQPFINLANQILSQKSEGKDTTLLEQEIDNLVYKLYELTYDEVKIIDPEFSLTQEEYEAIKLE